MPVQQIHPKLLSMKVTIQDETASLVERMASGILSANTLTILPL
jgi:hypothetical protein